MLWWQILLIVLISIVFIVISVGIGMYLMLRLMFVIFLNNDNYAKWIVASNNMKKLLRLKGINSKDDIIPEENGGY